MKIDDKDSFIMARRLISEEGYLCGGSSGSAMAAACQYIKKNNIGAGKRCIVICPDSIRNYLTKFINNDWLYEHNFITEQQCMEANDSKLIPLKVWGQEFKIKDLNLKPAVFIPDNMTCREAIEQIKKSSYD